MKTFVTLLTSFVIVFSAVAQTFPSSCVPTGAMSTIYRNDAIKLAVNRLQKTNNTYRDSIIIPVSSIDSAARVLYAIHNQPASLLRDTIMYLFGYTDISTGYDSLHATVTLPLAAGSNSNQSLKEISVKLATGLPWGSDWLAGNYNNTSNSQVNALVNNYQLTITFNFAFQGFNYFTVRAAAALNTAGLAAAFLQAGATSANPNTYNGDGNGIGMAYEPDGIRVSYRNGCGDCPSGCTFGRIWTFKVYFSNCNVEYIGAVNFGSPLPPGSTVSTCISIILPVNFGNVTASVQNRLALINWTVLTQVNVKDYQVERSDNGNIYYACGTVTANPLASQYQFKDGNPVIQKAWYRIKSQDLDGKFKYSPVVLVTTANSTSGFTIFPNPVKGRALTLRFGSPQTGSLHLSIYNAAGAIVFSEDQQLVPLTFSSAIKLPASLKPGSYTLAVDGLTVHAKARLLVE